MKRWLGLIRVQHVIAALLLLIWLQLGGAQSALDFARDATMEIKNIGQRKEEPAPMSDSEQEWARQFESSFYAETPASAASSR